MLGRALLLFSMLLAGAAQAAPVILVLGDSLSAAYGLPQATGWVSLLQQRLAREELDYRVVNASISGETTSGGLYRIGQTLAAHRPAIVILELGANDGLRGLPLDTIQANLEGIIRACRRQGATVLLLGMRLPPNYGMAYTRDFQGIYPKLAQRHRLRLVPFILEGIAGQPELLQQDGLHPAADAQPLILENVWKQLRPLLQPGAKSAQRTTTFASPSRITPISLA